VVTLALAPLEDPAEVVRPFGRLVVPEAEREPDPARISVRELDRLDSPEIERFPEGPLGRILDERRKEGLRRVDREVDADLLELVMDLPEVLEEALVDLGPVGEIFPVLRPDAAWVRTNSFFKDVTKSSSGWCSVTLSGSPGMATSTALRVARRGILTVSEPA